VELLKAVFAAVVSTLGALLSWMRWRHERVAVELTVRPRGHELDPNRLSHIEVDIQATLNPTTIHAVYLAAYKHRWGSMFGGEPSEVQATDWNKVFPIKVEPGHGWEGLLAINNPERSLAVRYPKVRLMVRHTGYRRIVGKDITKMLRG
jgi:hypothetical protein